MIDLWSPWSSGCSCLQVLSLKRAHPDLLLMVECGYRFRFFGEDALEAAKVRAMALFSNLLV